MLDHKHYTYRVTWSEEDNEHVALCAELPSLSFLADKPVNALQGLVELEGHAPRLRAARGADVRAA